MTKVYYLDACIWMDYYENRSDKFRPMGEWALMLIKGVIDGGGKIVISAMITQELRGNYDDARLDKIFEVAAQKNALIKIEITQSQVKEAAELCRKREVAFGDAMHAILARDHNAVMVTRDNHFLQLLDIVDVRKPEDLL